MDLTTKKGLSQPTVLKMGVFNDVHYDNMDLRICTCLKGVLIYPVDLNSSAVKFRKVGPLENHWSMTVCK